jgi:hypothetical protein
MNGEPCRLTTAPLFLFTAVPGTSGLSHSKLRYSHLGPGLSLDHNAFDIRSMDIPLFVRDRIGSSWGLTLHQFKLAARVSIPVRATPRLGDTYGTDLFRSLPATITSPPVHAIPTAVGGADGAAASRAHNIYAGKLFALALWHMMVAPNCYPK